MKNALQDLVGIPWKVRGRGLDGIDCVGLVELAQAVICNRKVHFPQLYDAGNIYEKSAIIKAEVQRLFVPVEEPTPGAVGLFYFCQCWHAVTFVTATHFLHIFEGKTSQISRLSRGYKRYFEGVYVWREQR